jgi:hypothetical protein
LLLPLFAKRQERESEYITNLALLKEEAHFKTGKTALAFAVKMQLAGGKLRVTNCCSKEDFSGVSMEDFAIVYVGLKLQNKRF